MTTSRHRSAEEVWLDLVAGRRSEASSADPAAAALIERYGSLALAGGELAIAQLGHRSGYCSTRKGGRH